MLQLMIHFRDEEGDETRDMLGIGAFFSAIPSHRMVILGDPGAGKTVLAIELVLQLVRPIVREIDRTSPVPVRFPAVSWANGQDLEQWLTERLIIDYGIYPLEAKDLVEQRRILPVLDGLDEMDPEPKPGSPGASERASALLDAFNMYNDIGTPAPVVITCRAHRYEQLVTGGHSLAKAQIISMRNLDTEQLQTYLLTRYPVRHPLHRPWQEALADLAATDGIAARAALATPWKLLLAVTASEDKLLPAPLLRTHPGEDLQRATKRINDALLAAYIPAATRLYARTWRVHRIASRRARYGPEHVTTWLRSLAFYLEDQGNRAANSSHAPAGMSGIDITPHLLWQIGGIRLVRCIHVATSLFAASAGMAVACFILIGTPSDWARRTNLLLTGSYPMTSLIINSASVLVIFAVPIYIACRSALPWPAPSIDSRAHLALRQRTTLGALYSMRGAALFVPIGILIGGFAFGFAGGAAFSLGYGLLHALDSEQSWGSEVNLTSPRAALSREFFIKFTVAALGGAWISFAGEVANSLTVPLLPGLVYGAIAGILIGLPMMAPAWWRHCTGLIIAVFRHRLPMRLGRFLDWACEAGLLRASGATYQFRHRELQEWLQDSLPQRTPPVEDHAANRERRARLHDAVTRRYARPGGRNAVVRSPCGG
jgi:hypothetical protein